MNPRSFAVALGIAAVSSCSDPVSPPPEETPISEPTPSVYPIVFASARDSTYSVGGGKNLEILAAKLNGSEFLNLSRNPAPDFDPAWSPDGKWVAFTSYRDGSADIFVMRDDGTSVRKLINDPLNEGHASWSPDGRQIVFESQRDGVAPCANCFRNTDIFIADADGSHLRNLTKTPAASETNAAWSPDGKTIAFIGGGTFLINADGSSRRRLYGPHPDFADDAVAWSPDGSRLAISAFNNRHPPFLYTYVILTVRADGTDLRVLTGTGFESSRFAAWSPDGTELVYTNDAPDEAWGLGGRQNVWVMNADGSGKRSLTADAQQHNQTGSPQAWRR